MTNRKLFLGEEKMTDSLRGFQDTGAVYVQPSVYALCQKYRMSRLVDVGLTAWVILALVLFVFIFMWNPPILQHVGPDKRPSGIPNSTQVLTIAIFTSLILTMLAIGIYVMVTSDTC